MNIGILGLGEVGSALKKLTATKHQVYVRELAFDEIADHPIDILHVCIPFTPKFMSLVTKAVKEIKPQLVIINSTVMPGTTDELFRLTGIGAVHAPILGIHPNLYEYLFKFVKPLGAVNQDSYRQAKSHFESLGVKTEKFASPLDTELAKIMETTYYGWVILFQKWVHQVCATKGANFDQVYTRFNQIYNQGYSEDLPHVARPILKHQPGEIGGHCVIPNATIIQDWLQDDFTKFMLTQNQRLAKSHAKT